VKRALPGRLFNWFRRKRINVLEAAGGATSVTPSVLKRAAMTKTHPARSTARRLVARVLPSRVVTHYRRRRVTRKYLEALSWELLERETRLDYLEGRVAARRDGFYQRIVADVLDRTEIILQELDRRIEGVAARSGQELAAVEEQLAGLRADITRLREAQDRALGSGSGPGSGSGSGSVVGGNGDGASARDEDAAAVPEPAAARPE
jgi:hypothetical protein